MYNFREGKWNGEIWTCKVQKECQRERKVERENLKEKKNEILSFLRQYKFTLFFFSLVFFCGR